MVARLISLGALLVVGMASAQEPRPNYLTHEQLKALISGTTTIQIASGRMRVIGIYTQDGIARLDGGNWAAKGTWRIDSNKFCTKYPGIRRGYETCYNLVNTGENAYSLYFAEDGALNSTWVIEK